MDRLSCGGFELICGYNKDDGEDYSLNDFNKNNDECYQTFDKLLGFLLELDPFPDCKGLVVACQIRDNRGFSALAVYAVDVFMEIRMFM